jgi:hypothetical protein
MLHAPDEGGVLVCDTVEVMMQIGVHAVHLQHLTATDHQQLTYYGIHGPEEQGPVGLDDDIDVAPSLILQL